jgi:cell wall-associated NlpC family hydrolase
MKLPVVMIAVWLAAAPSGAALANDPAPPAADSRAETLLARVHDLVLNAMSLMGIPYKWGGAAPETGFDCSGFVQFVFRQAAGVILPRSSFDQVRHGTSVTQEELQPGDLVFFNTLRAPFSHVGIYVGENRFIHAPSRGKSVEIVDFTNSYWQKRYNGARRLPL